MFPALINKRITHFLRYIKNIKHQETTVHYSTSSALHSHWSRKTTSVSSVSQSCEQKVEPMNKTTAFLSVNQSTGRMMKRPPISSGGWTGWCWWFSEALEGGVRTEKRSWFGRIYCWVHGWVELISGAVFKPLMCFLNREVWFCSGRTEPMG